MALLAGIFLAIGKESLAGRGGTALHFIENIGVGAVAALLVGYLWTFLANFRDGGWPGRDAIELHFLSTLLVFSTNLIPTNGQGLLHFFDEALFGHVSVFRDSVWLLNVLRVFFCSLVALSALRLLCAIAPKKLDTSIISTGKVVRIAVEPALWMALISAAAAYISIYIL